MGADACATCSGLIARAEKRGACKAALQASVGEMAYEPVPVELPQSQ